MAKKKDVPNKSKTNEDKKPVGRPPITLEDLPKDWKSGIIALAKKGASIIELSVYLEISRDTFYALSDREEEFSDTVKMCKEFSEAWWHERGRKNLTNPAFSYTGWYMNMKNRFGWKDKQEISGDQQNPVQVITGMRIT